MRAVPDEIVAEEIQERFKQEGLLKESDFRQLARKLAPGDISRDDWKAFAENSVELEERKRKEHGKP